MQKLLFILREKCPYSEIFWSVFSRIQTEYGEIWSTSPYSVRMWENTDQENSEYGHFSRSVKSIIKDTRATFMDEKNLAYHLKRVYPFSTNLKLSEKLIFFIPDTYTYMSVGVIKGLRSVSFSKNFVRALNGRPQSPLIAGGVRDLSKLK